MGTYRDLDAWKKGIELAKKVYEITSDFPTEERFGLANQMRRSSVSIPSNIAEGYGRGSDNEIVQFLHVSLGSSNELDTQLAISFKVSFLDEITYNEVSNLNIEVNKMISSLLYRRKKRLDSNLMT